MVSQMTGMATTTIHAPLANLVISTMTSTTAVKHGADRVDRPGALIMRRRTARSVVVRSSRFQCRIMPVWLQPNETKTPMM